jgi:uncharacterized protein (TIRG00374 family)
VVEMKFKASKKTLLLPLLGIAVFLAYIYIFGVDIFQIIDVVQGIKLDLYILAAVNGVLDTFFFTVAWYFLLRFLSIRISLAKAYLFVWFGIFVDTIIPAESLSGEISRVYLVSKENNGVVGKVTASLVAQRLLGTGITIASLLAGIVFLFSEGQLYGMMLNLTLLLTTLTFIFLFLIILLCIREQWTMRVLEAAIKLGERISGGRWKLDKIRENAEGAAKAFHNAIREFGSSPKTLILASSSSMVSWILFLSVFYLCFLSVGYTTISWGAILVICSIFTAAKSIPIGIPFEVGLPEITLTTLFMLVGVPPQTSATVTVLIRILTLWFRFFIGFAVQQWLVIKSIEAPKFCDYNNNLINM